jgi:hypothetical protein
LTNFLLTKEQFRRCTLCARVVHAYHPPILGEQRPVNQLERCLNQ